MVTFDDGVESFELNDDGLDVDGALDVDWLSGADVLEVN
jgi:hypothetical protein